MTSSEPVTLGLIATENVILTELFEKHLPEGWNFVQASTNYDDAHYAMLAQADYVIMAGGWMPRASIERAPKLKMVQKMGVGFDGIDFDALKERGIVFANTPLDSASLAVAEHAVALAVSALKVIPFLDNAVRREADWPRWEPRRRIRLMGMQTVGVVGFGRIARHAARLFLGLGCKVIVWARRRPDDFEQFAAETHAGDRIRFESDLDTVFRDSSIVSLHVALSDETRGMANRHRLDLLGPQGMIVNTARGGVINEPELILALREGRLGSAALDVLTVEPPQGHNELFDMSNVIITPHCATGGTDVQEEKLLFGLKNIKAFREGREVEARLA
jgi:phosphoglycerate dehydrogenase-like enzyme